ncbi:unnamed protein product [Cylindrotheca closterium]|uniref:CW-type domain-containing protein n=1 Tax=Cylindrotheca closterium TaxID=2856 RepID=A0AAD2FJ45_9STRA|nr:unnamed protein product [Cylindrotheca closterium]
MSSLRLALKQSLQETGHLLPKEKKKRGAKTRNKDKLSSSSSKDHSSQPRKRGRPPKRPSRTEGDADKAEKGPHDEEGEENEAGFSSENEFSYDSEEESGSEENDSEEEEEEDEDDHEDEEDDITAAVVAESQDKQLDNDPRGNNNNNNNNGEPTMSERDTNDHLTTTKHNSSSTKEDEEMDSEEERRRRQRKLLKKKIKNSAANKIQSQWKKRQGRPSSALSETEEEERKSSKTIEEETETAPSKSAAAEDTTATANSSSNSNSNSNSKESEESEIKGNKQSSADTNETAAPTVEKKKRNSGTVPPPTHDVREWSQRLTEKKSRKNICKGMRVKVRFATKVRREGKIVKKRKWYGGRVSNVTPDGSKIKIKYDDGTSEISQFPDDDVVVDDTDNGQHSQAASASVHRFLPRQARSPTPTPTPTPTPAVVEEKEEEKKEVEEKVEEKEEEKPKEEVVKEDMPTEDSPKDDAPEEEVPKEEEAAKPTESSTAKEKEDDKVAEQIPVEKPQEEKEAQEGEEKEEEETPKEVEKDDTKMEEAPEAPEIKAPTPIPEESKPVPETTKPEADEEKPRSSPATTVDAAAAKPEKETIDPAKPVDHAEAMDTDEPTPKEAKPEAPKEEVAEMKQQEEKPSRSNSQKEEEKLEAKPSKPTLTIRISKAKVLENEKLEKHQGTPMQHKANGSQSSDEELDLDTPVTARKVKSLKVKRKRLSDETSPGGSRHKKRKAEVEEPTPPQDKSTEKTSGAATATEMSNEKPPKSPKKSSMVITIPLKQAQAGDEIPQVPSLTKPRKRKDSPAARGSGRKSPSPKSDSPQPMSQDLGKNGDETTMVRPVSQKAVKADGVESADLEMSTAEQTTKAELGSKGSAFGKKAKANADATTKESLPQTKDTEKAPKAGRKAAQEAKEKMGPKQQDKELAAKKKKKRRRKNGSDEEESDDDERQWVQCDKCQKWRILPSRVEASSLPEVWQCSMNDWDPKHSDCSVAEQTFKQIQKERRRAKKRAKQQRLEQAALEANPADSNHDPKVRGGKSSQNSPKPTRHVLKTGKNSDSESKRASPIPSAGNTSVESGLDSKAEKRGRKGKKDKDKDESKQVEVQRAVAAEEVTPKKPGRKRGRPARNVSVETPRSNATKDDENVEWVQCEKCEKWRKLPPYMAADELPDKWYCSLNTWNEASASCEAAEDKADAHHQEVGVFGNVPQGHVGKYSYRSMIYGSGRKYNRPMSEKARAAESLYQRPQVEDGIPQTSVMYAKSSMFVPRMSNFQKTQVVEKKTTSILDVLAESDLWAELQGVGHAMQLLSNNFSGDPYPAFVTYESLPESIKEQMRKVVLQVLGVYVLSGDELVEEALRFPWESLSGSLSQIRAFINADIVINTLLSLVRDGEVEMTCFKDMSVPMTEWVPRYRRVVRSSPKNLENHGSLKTSKCMKISKPWKQMDDSEGWITGGQ